jgi:oxygen-independent coproporphyrinogen-3 oxidase
VSNFAKPGYRSRHNGLYWTGEYYWGLGAGAHTYLPHAGRPVRRANLANPERYIAALNTGEPPVEFTEKLSPSMMQREKIMLALRTVDGLAPMEFGELEDKMIRTLTPHARHGRYSWDGRRFRPTPAGLLLADGVATELWELFAE